MISVGTSQHVGRQPGRVQRLDVLAGRDEHLAAQVPALLLGRQLVFPVHAGRARGDHGLHQLEGVQHAAEPGLGVGHDRGQPVGRAGRVAVLRLRPGDLVGAQQGVVDPADHLGHRVDRVEALVRVGLPGQVGVRRHLPAGQVDGLQARLDLLDRLVAGQRAERGARSPRSASSLRQPLGAAAGPACTPPCTDAAQPHHVLRPSRSARCRAQRGLVSHSLAAACAALLADRLHCRCLPQVRGPASLPRAAPGAMPQACPARRRR